MASMMGGDFVEAYVLKNAYKEEVRRMEEAEAKRSSSGAGAAVSAPGEKKETVDSSGRRGGRGGLFGLMKKKMHPRAAGSAMETSGASS